MIYKATVGSRMHGLHTPESDYDYREVFMLDLTTKLSPFRNVVHKKLKNGDEDSEAFELCHFLKLLISGNPTAYEILWSPLYDMDQTFTRFKENKHWFLNTTAIAPAHIGCADSQLGGYLYRALEDPSILEQDNHVRRMKKAAVAGIRVLHQASQLLQFGDFCANVAEYDTNVHRELKAIKYMDDSLVDTKFLEEQVLHINSLKEMLLEIECEVVASGKVYEPQYDKIENELVRIYRSAP